MYLQLTKEQIKNFKSVKDDYEFGPFRVIESISNELRLLQREGFSVTELAKILKVELKYEITPGYLRKILSRMKKEPIKVALLKNMPKDESKRVVPRKDPQEDKINPNLTHMDKEVKKENTDRSHDPNNSEEDRNNENVIQKDNEDQESNSDTSFKDNTDNSTKPNNRQDYNSDDGGGIVDQSGGFFNFD